MHVTAAGLVRTILNSHYTCATSGGVCDGDRAPGAARSRPGAGLLIDSLGGCPSPEHERHRDGQLPGTLWRGGVRPGDQGGRQEGGVDAPDCRRRSRAQGVVLQALVGGQRAREEVLEARAVDGPEAHFQGRQPQPVARRDAAQLPHAEAQYAGSGSLEIEGKAATKGGSINKGTEPITIEPTLAVVREVTMHRHLDDFRSVVEDFRQERFVDDRSPMCLLVVRRHVLQADAGRAGLARPPKAAGHLRINSSILSEILKAL